jgi:hypothetical protein
VCEGETRIVQVVADRLATWKERGVISEMDAMGWADNDHVDADGSSNILVRSSVEEKETDTNKERNARPLTSKATGIVREIIVIFNTAPLYFSNTRRYTSQTCDAPMSSAPMPTANLPASSRI